MLIHTQQNKIKLLPNNASIFRAEVVIRDWSLKIITTNKNIIYSDSTSVLIALEKNKTINYKSLNRIK